jgi:hypothetical protein
MKTKIISLIAFLAILFSGCEDFLDRKDLTNPNDDNFWTSETKVRLYANEYYGRYFAGYGLKGSVSYAALQGYGFNDDFVNFGNQPEFEKNIPTTRGSTSTSDADPVWLTNYTGPTWNFGWVRKSNIMMERINERMSDILNDEQKNHWIGIARFFRAMEYAGLVTVFGDVPYYDHEVSDANKDDLYKPRTPRNEVMDYVYDDLKFAMENVRLNDGDQYVNRYVVAGYISRLALVEGTWQKYHYNNTERAKKFLELSVEAADYLRLSGKYDIVTDFRSLFGSTDLKGNKDCIFYRHYDAGANVTHSIASNCNLSESRNMGPSLSLIKAFICNDGKDWKSSTVANAKNFKLEEMIKTRDPRFEASFWTKPSTMAKGSFLYITKFIDRTGPTYAANGEATPAQYTSTNNVNDYPVLRYAEILLNWIEAKAELETLGSGTVDQAAIDASINKIRQRVLDSEAEAKGVKQTANMDLTALPNDVDRDPDVSPLIWEIRRERRMELAFEHSRIIDLRRWKKLQYMDTDLYPDLLKGTWVDFPNELPEHLAAANVGILAVTDMNGITTVYDGSNGSKMVGFYSPTQNKSRLPFLNLSGINPYLSPVGTNQRVDYKNKGYDLAQTEGWSDVLP